MIDLFKNGANVIEAIIILLLAMAYFLFRIMAILEDLLRELKQQTYLKNIMCNFLSTIKDNSYKFD